MEWQSCDSGTLGNPCGDWYSSLETKYVVVYCDRNSILYVIGTNSILNEEGTGMDLILSITAPSFLLFHDVH